MDNGGFRAQVDLKVEEIASAYLAYFEDSIFEASMRSLLEPCKPLWRQKFLGFGISNSSDARQSVSTLDNGEEYLRNISSNELGTALESIQRGIADWHGVAKTSFANYVNGVETALEYQRECAEILSGLLKIQGALIDAGHEYALQIADQTIKALEKVIKEEDKHERDMLGNIVEAVAVGIGAGVIGGGAKGVIGGAITAIGGVASAVVKGAGGAGPNEVLDWMDQELDKAATTMNDDRLHLSEAIGACETNLFSQPGPRTLLPPDVDLTAV